MKKFVLFVMILTLILSLAACSNTDADPDDISDKSSPSTAPTHSNNVSSTPAASPSPSVSTEDTTRPAASADLSKKWSSFQFELQGKLYTLPLSYSELEADGWTIKDRDDLENSLEADKYYVSYITLVYNGKENTEISAQFANLEDTEKSLEDCYVSGIQLAEYSWTENTVLYLPGGITLGSTKEDVEALYGQPSETQETSQTIEWKYQIQNYDDIILTFTSETGKVEKIRMSNAYLS